MNDNIPTEISDEKIDMSTTLVVLDYDLSVGRLSDPVDCACGGDHSEDKFLIMSLHTQEGPTRKIMTLEGSPFWNMLMTGRITEEAQTCLARLLLHDVD